MRWRVFLLFILGAVIVAGILVADALTPPVAGTPRPAEQPGRPLFGLKCLSGIGVQRNDVAPSMFGGGPEWVQPAFEAVLLVIVFGCFTSVAVRLVRSRRPGRPEDRAG